MVSFFLTCEHGGNQVPPEYQFLFTDAAEALKSHRGWDPGALALYRAMISDATTFSIYSETTRLLVDLNRSLNRKTLFSEFSAVLSPREKEAILNDYYYPFRQSFGDAAEAVLQKGDEIFHVSVHSFTPVFNGEIRNADLGLLFHPGHGDEKEWAVRWKRELQKEFPAFRIRFNYPYLGKTDGHVAALRLRFGVDYAGIELEMNNKYAYDERVQCGIVNAYHRLCNRPAE